MSDEELKKIVATISAGGNFLSDTTTTRHVKLLRSIEIAALREAQGIVEEHVDCEVSCIWDEFTRRIREIELK